MQNALALSLSALLWFEAASATIEDFLQTIRRHWAITQAICTSFKVELFQAVHNFTNTTGHSFKIALYADTATLGATTTVYTTSGEITGTGYSAGGYSLTSVTPTSSGTTAICDFADAAWSNATITAFGAMIYNSSASNKAVLVLSFGSNQASTAGTFTVVFPAADASNAILRAA